MIDFPNIQNRFHMKLDKYSYEIVEDCIRYSFKFDNGIGVHFDSDTNIPYNMDDKWIRSLVESHIINLLENNLAGK